MNTPLSVANFFVAKSLDTGEELTLLKLIKLVYISHGWHLAVKDEDLLSEAVEAWKYGPVVPAVYHKFKSFANSQITSFADEEQGSKRYFPKIENEETIALLETVWEKYKEYNGLQLSTLTHLKNSPWDKVFNAPQNFGKKGLIIPNNLIKEHYRQKLIANRKSVHEQSAG
ncbi:MAG: type II toxin-antitoxin system antitoxin SocA domain-containing protein [Chitinophagaceae bacterium]